MFSSASSKNWLHLRSAALFAIIISFIAGCSAQPPMPNTALKLYAFDCGRLNYDSVKPLGIDDQETEVRDLIVPCYVIEHDKGRMLWEGGLPSSFADTDGWQEIDGGWRIRLDETFEAQLAELDLSMSDFDLMSFSHFHFDHIGVANEIKGAKLIVQKKEYEAAFSDRASALGFSPELYDNLKEADKIVIEEEYDVFGDGKVLLIPAPGHTPGHQVLYLDLSETGPVVLSGDLHIFRVGRAKRRVPPFNFDQAQTLESMARIESFLEERGASLWIGHELAQFDQLKKPPEYQD